MSELDARLVQQQVVELSRKGWYHSIELPGGDVVQGLVSIDALKARLAAFPIPRDLTGKRVLDVGAWTGWCSFEMERRGADVVAVDCIEFEEFRAAHRMVGSKVEYRILEVDELSPESVGLFDYVLFFGVLYHLRNPLLGLEKVCAITKDTAFVESFVIDEGATAGDSGSSVMEFYETDELGGQIDNWFGPNTRCLLALCRSAGFARVSLEYAGDRRAGVTCRRLWEVPPEHQTDAPPWIYSAVNNRTNDIYFHSGKDEYICLYFKSDLAQLTKDQMRVEIDGYGAPALVLASLGRGEWQVNLRVPPGLGPGPHEVRLRTPGSLYGNRFEIVMRAGSESPPPEQNPLPAPSEAATGPAPILYEVGSGVTDSAHFHGYKNEYLRLRFRTAEMHITREHVILEIDRMKQPILFLTDLGNNSWQTNSRLPVDLKPGPHFVRIRTLQSGFSNEEQILFDPDRA